MLFAAMLCLLNTPRPKAVLPAYRVVDIGTLGGVYTQALAVNDKGQAVGQADEGGQGVGVAVLWDGQRLHRLFTPSGSQSAALAISNAGQIAGWTETGADTDKQMCAWDTHDPAAQPFRQFGNGSGAVCGVNSAGDCAGYVSASAGIAAHAYLWRGGSNLDLGPLGGAASYALAINSSGDVVVGHSETGAGRTSHAFLWQKEKMHDLPTLGGTQAGAAAVNDGSAAVGFSTLAGDGARHATLWKAGRIVDLGTLGGRDSTATGINSAGVIVGWSDVPGAARSHACLWVNRRPVDLNDCLAPSADWTLWQAFGVSKNGTVCGYGLHAGEIRGFLLVPAKREPVPNRRP